jgi:hypothetical protein
VLTEMKDFLRSPPPTAEAVAAPSSTIKTPETQRSTEHVRA